MQAVSPARDRFLEKLRTSLRDGSFVKITLSEPTGDGDLRNVYGRIIEIKGAPHLSLVYRYERRDVTKNFAVAQAAEVIVRLLEDEFRRAYLFTTEGDLQWANDAKGGSVKASRPRFAVAPEPVHDREKNSALPDDAAFLQALGVTNERGEPRPGKAGKLRQIQRFVELCRHLIERSPLRDRKSLRVVDMGAGKGYLTFALHAWLTGQGIAAEVIGVEARPDLVTLTNELAAKLGCTGLRFVPGTIADFTLPDGVDILIALHACDTATDDALHQGLKNQAPLLLTAPCCHKEVRVHWDPAPVLRPVITHGILAEREAEIATDALRALLLELQGYEAEVFEFVSPEHSGKNLMISAQRRVQPLDPAPIRERLRELLDFYGVREQRLARLLGEL